MGRIVAETKPEKCSVKIAQLHKKGVGIDLTKQIEKTREIKPEKNCFYKSGSNKKKFSLRITNAVEFFVDLWPTWLFL